MLTFSRSAGLYLIHLLHFFFLDYGSFSFLMVAGPAWLGRGATAVGDSEAASVMTDDERDRR